MKKWMILVLTWVCVLSMTGCNKKSMDYIIENESIVTGIVEEMHDDYIIMYSDSAEGYPNGSRWSISLDVENKDSYTDFVAGDEIVMYHDGNVMETEPLKVGTVYAITLKTPAERADKEVQGNETGNSYEGAYLAYDINEPILFIQKNEDGTYDIQIGIYKLVQLYNCVGVENGNRLVFSTTEWGEEQEITGTIILDDDVATVTLEAPWSDTWFKDVNEYQYYKTSSEQHPVTEESIVESIQDEISRIEEQSREHLEIDASTMGQQRK